MGLLLLQLQLCRCGQRHLMLWIWFISLWNCCRHNFFGTITLIMAFNCKTSESEIRSISSFSLNSIVRQLYCFSPFSICLHDLPNGDRCSRSRYAPHCLLPDIDARIWANTQRLCRQWWPAEKRLCGIGKLLDTHAFPTPAHWIIRIRTKSLYTHHYARTHPHIFATFLLVICKQVNING